MIGRRILASALAVAAIAGAAEARGRLVSASPFRGAAHELLYLPNGKYLKAISLGQAPLLADLVYLWAIQYYSNYERQDRYKYVEHVFGSVIAELDPAYIDAYWLGALILTTEAGDLEAGLRVLEKGYAANPRQWVLPYLAAWECERVGDFTRAADYFRRAAETPGAPTSVARLRAGMVARSHDLRQARALWIEIAEDGTADPNSREIARRRARELTVRIDLAALRRAVADFETRSGRRPRALDELVAAGLVREIPPDPDGRPYAYDRSTGRISSPAESLLGTP